MLGAAILFETDIFLEGETMMNRLRHCSSLARFDR
jgi:hypothetical protein